MITGITGLQKGSGALSGGSPVLMCGDQLSLLPFLVGVYSDAAGSVAVFENQTKKTAGTKEKAAELRF